MYLSINKFHIKWALVLGLMGAIVAWALILNSKSYLEARNYLHTNPDVQSEFGLIRYSFLYAASIKNSHANFIFYVVGDKKSSSVILFANEESGHWVVKASSP